MKTNLVLPLLSTIAVLTAILAAPVAAALLGGVLFVGGIVALMARDYSRPTQSAAVSPVSRENPLRLAA